MTHTAMTAMDTTAILRFLAEINVCSPCSHNFSDAEQFLMNPIWASLVAIVSLSSSKLQRGRTFPETRLPVWAGPFWGCGGLTTPAIEHDFKEASLPLGKVNRKWSQAEAQWGHVRTGYELGELVCKCHEAGLDVVGAEKYGATIAQALYQLWYLRDLSWLFSRKLVLPRLLMELALRLDHLLFRNRGCAIAIKAVRR